MFWIRKSFIFILFGAVMGLFSVEKTPIGMQKIALTDQLHQIAFTSGVLDEDGPVRRFNKTMNAFLKSASDVLFEAPQ